MAPFLSFLQCCTCRCIIELALHATYYLSDDDLLARIRAQEEFLTSSPCGEVSVQGAEVINKAYEQDVISTCSQGSYASMWQILALGAVVDRKVKSVYPLIAKTTAHSKVSSFKHGRPLLFKMEDQF